MKIQLSEAELDEIVRQSTQQNHTAWQLLERFLAVPAGGARERAIERRVPTAKFPSSACMESFDWTFNTKTILRGPLDELATGEFIGGRDNIIFVGKSGLGKSHLIQGIGRSCCASGHRVRYVTSAELLEDLMSAAGAKSLSTRVRYYRSFEFLIIDAFGFDKLERREYPESLSLLYKVVAARSGRGSTAFITNVDFSQWTQYLGDPLLVMALLDRVVDSAITIRFDGKSYRQHRAEQMRSSASNRAKPST